MRSVAVALLTLAAIAAVPSRASACASVMWREHQQVSSPTSPLVARLQKAAQDLTSRRLQVALDGAKAILSDPQAGALSSYQRANAQRILGLAALDLGLPSLAEAYLAEASKLLWSVAAPYARAQMAAGHVREAREQLEKRLQERSLDADAWATLAQARQKLGDQSGALAAVDEALRIEPQNEQAIAVKSSYAVASR